MTHTPEPWSISDAPYQIVGPVGQTIAKLTSLDMDNARRIVACVNAAAGIPTEVLEQAGPAAITAASRLKMVEAKIAKLRDDYAAQGLALKAAKAMQAGETERADRAEAQRDQLLSALIGLVDDIQGLMEESDGVAGLHRNGDLAPWSELEAGGEYERLSHLPDAISAIATAKKGNSA